MERGLGRLRVIRLRFRRRVVVIATVLFDGGDHQLLLEMQCGKVHLGVAVFQKPHGDIEFFKTQGPKVVPLHDMIGLQVADAIGGKKVFLETLVILIAVLLKLAGRGSGQGYFDFLMQLQGPPERQSVQPSNILRAHACPLSIVSQCFLDFGSKDADGPAGMVDDFFEAHIRGHNLNAWRRLIAGIRHFLHA